MCLKSLLKVDATSQTETEAVAAADVDAIGEPQVGSFFLCVKLLLQLMLSVL